MTWQKNKTGGRRIPHDREINTIQKKNLKVRKTNLSEGTALTGKGKNEYFIKEAFPDKRKTVLS